MSEKDRLEEAIHNFIMSYIQEETKAEAVAFLRSEIKALRQSSNENITPDLEDLRDIKEEVDQALFSLDLDDQSYTRRTLVDLKLSLRRLING
jgi:prefoldin subunit 5